MIRRHKKHANHILLLFMCILLTVSVSSCVYLEALEDLSDKINEEVLLEWRNYQAPPSGFMAQKGTLGIIWVSSDKEPTAKFYKMKKKVDDSAIRAIITSHKLLDVRLQKERLTPLVKKFYLNVFSAAFSDEGFEVKIVETPYDPEDIPDAATKLRVNYLMVLDVLVFGVGSAYHNLN